MYKHKMCAYLDFVGPANWSDLAYRYISWSVTTCYFFSCRYVISNGHKYRCAQLLYL